MLLGLLAISAMLPFVMIGMLAVMARLWKTNPRVMLPWLRALRWLTWIIGLLLVGAVLKDPPPPRGPPGGQFFVQTESLR